MNDDTRPDPDQLLARLKDDEAQAARGKLKIFFGANAGVGKTFAMLQRAHALRREGAEPLVGLVETHGRLETQALVQGLEVLPLRQVAHKGRTLPEFDLDAALQRRPPLLLLDELAHSNAPGSRHPKRWQDVEELLDAGIDVWSTMNVQHLESLNDIVSGITGIRVWETVPDRIFDEADEVVIVDLPPDELLQRLQQGKVYLPQQAATAARNFFRKGNLIALRELALRRTADRVDDEVQAWRRRQSVRPVWPTREALLLCIGPDPRADKLVRAAARMAAQLDVPWHCLYVETPRLQRLPDDVRQRTLRLLAQAEEAGATTATLAGGSLAATVVRYAQEHNLSRVLLGRDTGRWPRPWRHTLAEAVGAMGPDLDVIQIALPAREQGTAPATRPWWAWGDAAADTDDAGEWWTPYAKSAAVCALAAAAAAPLQNVFELANIVMVFLLAVVIVAARFGRGPAVMAAFLSVAAFDFLYVEPKFSFSVSDVQYLLTFGVMLVIALVIGQMTAGLKFQARVAMRREARVSALYAMSRDLSGVLMVEQVAEIAGRFLASEFDASAALLVADEHDRLTAPVPVTEPAPAMAVDLGVAQWAHDHAEAAGLGTNTLPASPMLYLPLKAPMRQRGVLAIAPRRPGRLTGPEQRRLLETCASLLAISLERLHYVAVAQQSTVQMESERLRNSLLAAISHDLRTPLAALVGMGETLASTPPPAPERQAELARAVRESALRMRSQVHNLLDMARLQSGQVQLQRQWLPLEEALGSAIRAMSQEGSTSVQGQLDPARVQVRLPNHLPLLRVDPALFERVLCNLLENAAKYTPPGSLLRFSAGVMDERLRITLDDDGPGLPRGREEAVFQMFERGHKESATPGVGLGLAICRAIVQAHGGTIHGEQRPGGGARFVIELPLEAPPPMEELPAPVEDDDPAEQGTP